MSGFSEYIGSQFGNPRGFAEQICCVVMNVINRKMYKKTKSDLHGVDISEDMLKLATKRNKEACCLLNQYCLLLEKYCKGKKFCGNIY